MRCRCLCAVRQGSAPCLTLRVRSCLSQTVERDEAKLNLVLSKLDAAIRALESA